MIKEKHKWLVSALIGILGIAIPVGLYFISMTERTLTYEIISKSNLIGSHHGVKDIEVKIKGEIVESASIFVLRLSNTGTEPVKPEDFEREIRISYSDSSKVLDAKIGKKLPKNISANIKFQENGISIDPLLMNPGDMFEIELLSTSTEYPSFDSRIAGIKTIESVVSERSNIPLMVLTLIVSFLLITIYLKFFMDAINKGKNIFSRAKNFAFGALCAFAAILLADDYYDPAENPSISVIILVCASLTSHLLSIIDKKYNKPIQPTAEASAD